MNATLGDRTPPKGHVTQGRLLRGGGQSSITFVQFGGLRASIKYATQNEPSDHLVSTGAKWSKTFLETLRTHAKLVRAFSGNLCPPRPAPQTGPKQRDGSGPNGGPHGEPNGPDLQKNKNREPNCQPNGRPNARPTGRPNRIPNGMFPPSQCRLLKGAWPKSE